jgi:hypothetical protein
MATLRYSHLDPNVKQVAINELIYIAPTVAMNIANNANQNGGSILGKGISESIQSLAATNELITPVIKILFKK